MGEALLELTELAERVHAFIQTAVADGADQSTASASAAEFNRLALALFALQSRSNPAVRAWLDASGIASRQPAHWQDIPALPIAAFKELEVTSLPAGLRTNTFHSSGTTGQRPSRHFHCPESLRLYEASLLPWFRRHVPGVFAAAPFASVPRQVYLTPSPVRAPHSSLVHMFGTIAANSPQASPVFTGRIAADGLWELDFPAIHSALASAIRDRAPVLLCGTAFLFVHLLDALGKSGEDLSLPAGSSVLETGGYKGRSRMLPKDELHAGITQALGIPAVRIVCEYGMSELSSQAYDTVLPAAARIPRHFQFPPWARAVIVSPETGREVGDGETGLIRIYDLANVWSAMAVQTEDLAVRRGDRFELLGRAAFAEPRGCSLITA